MRYRDITTGDHEPVTSTPGPAPELVWIALDYLRIDTDFQRPLSRKGWSNIRKIAGSFSWAYFSPVIVAPIEGGAFSVIDGQHRCHAARLAGIDRVPCSVLPLSTQEQARAFGAINTQTTAITPFNIYRAALAAGDQWATDSLRVTTDANCNLLTYTPSGASLRAGDLTCVGLIRAEIEAGRIVMLGAALQSMWASPSAAHPALWKIANLRPYLAALRAHPAAKTADLPKFMAAHNLLQVGRRVDQMRSQEKYSATSRAALFTSVLAALLGKWLAEEASQ